MMNGLGVQLPITLQVFEVRKERSQFCQLERSSMATSPSSLNRLSRFLLISNITLVNISKEGKGKKVASLFLSSFLFRLN